MNDLCVVSSKPVSLLSKSQSGDGPEGHQALMPIMKVQ